MMLSRISIFADMLIDNAILRKFGIRIFQNCSFQNTSDVSSETILSMEYSAVHYFAGYLSVPFFHNLISVQFFTSNLIIESTYCGYIAAVHSFLNNAAPGLHLVKT